MIPHDDQNPKVPQTHTEPNPLETLLVFDRLEVGPVRLENRRLSPPYRIVDHGRDDRVDLTYGYEEAVFDPKEPESANLAALIAAQVAINYGLFFRSIIFHGPYDDVDRRFIREMAENTAREIMIAHLVALVEDLQSLSLDEIYHRKF